MRHLISVYQLLHSNTFPTPLYAFYRYSKCEFSITILITYITYNSRLNRSSYQRRSAKKALLKYFAVFTGKHLCWILYTKHKCFPVNIAKFLKTLILKKICEQLLLTKKLSPFCTLFSRTSSSYEEKLN